MSTGLERVSVFADGLDHPEGVTITRDGVIYAGGEAGQVYRIDPSGEVVQVADTGGFLLGICSDAAGVIYACDVKRREVLRIDGDATSVYSTGTNERAMVNPNWPVFDDDGRLFVTDSGGWKADDGCIFRIEPGGDTSIWCDAVTNFPNGACLSAEGDALLLLESCGPTLNKVHINDDGSAGVIETLAELPGTIPDGVTLDSTGRAYVCCYRPDRILTVDPDGTVSVLADDPEGTALSAPTNAVWLEGDLVTGNLGRWHLSRVQVGATGVPLRYPKVGSSHA